MSQRIDRHNWFADFGDLISEIPRRRMIKEMQAFSRLAYNQEDNDCGVRALAVSCAAPYDKAHWALQEAGRLAGNSCSVSQIIGAAARLNCRMVGIVCKGKTLLTVERALAGTHGGFIVTTTNHAVGLWNGELIDHARGSRSRVDTVYRIEPMQGTAARERFDNQNRSTAP